MRAHLSRTGPTPVPGFIDLPATSQLNGIFNQQLDISTLPNAKYTIAVEGEDIFGNSARDDLHRKFTHASRF